MAIFGSLLSRERVGTADPLDKESALSAALDLLLPAPAVSDPAALADALRAREAALPTGLGWGLGVPHVRHWSTREAVGALVVLRRGVEYGSMDRQPVRAVFAVALPEDSQHLWLLCLAELSRLFLDAIVISMPILGTLFLVSLSTGLISKAAPQINLLSEGFPISITVAFLLIWSALPFMTEMFGRVIGSGFETLRSLYIQIGQRITPGGVL